MPSADGLGLAGIQLAGPGRMALVVCHGFTHHTAQRATQGVLHTLARSGPVVALDPRGHGRSGAARAGPGQL